MSDSWIAVGRSSSLTVGRSSSRAAASAARPHRHALATTLAPAHVRTRASDMHKCMHKCIHTSTAWQRQLARAHTCSQRRGSALSAKVVEEMVLGSQSTCHLAASDVSGETASVSPSGPSKKVSDIGPLRLLLPHVFISRSASSVFLTESCRTWGWQPMADFMLIADAYEAAQKPVLIEAVR